MEIYAQAHYFLTCLSNDWRSKLLDSVHNNNIHHNETLQNMLT